MPTDTEKLQAEAEEARLAYEAAQEKAAKQAEAEKQRCATIEAEFYATQEDDYFAAPQRISAARAQFIEAARSGNLQVAFCAWLDWQRTWTEEATWVQLLHHRIYGPGGSRPSEKNPGHTTMTPIVAQRHGVGDFSKDLGEALYQPVKDAASAYVSERTADLRKALGK